MVKRSQVYRSNKTELYILITGFNFYGNILVYVLNKEHYLHRVPHTMISNESIITEKFTLVANNYAAK